MFSIPGLDQGQSRNKPVTNPMDISGEDLSLRLNGPGSAQMMNKLNFNFATPYVFSRSRYPRGLRHECLRSLGRYDRGFESHLGHG
jgi:hypothetical protein